MRCSVPLAFPRWQPPPTTDRYPRRDKDVKDERVRLRGADERKREEEKEGGRKNARAARPTWSVSHGRVRPCASRESCTPDRNGTAPRAAVTLSSRRRRRRRFHRHHRRRQPPRRTPEKTRPRPALTRCVNRPVYIVLVEHEVLNDVVTEDATGCHGLHASSLLSARVERLSLSFPPSL